MGRKFSRASSARVDREGSFELQGCLAEAWLVKEAAAILLASWIPDGRSHSQEVGPEAAMDPIACIGRQ